MRDGKVYFTSSKINYLLKTQNSQHQVFFNAITYFSHLNTSLLAIKRNFTTLSSLHHIHEIFATQFCVSIGNFPL